MENQYVLSESASEAIESLQARINMLEQDRAILLELGNDITKVREKSDLITLLLSRLKNLFHFNHAVILLVEPEKEMYRLFLYDESSAVIRSHPEFAKLIDRQFPLNEPFIRQVMDAGEPLPFLLEDVMHAPGSPRFLRVNYEAGMREILVVPLKSKMETIGFVNVYSDRAGSFTSEFTRIIKGIAPQLSSAVSNISANEDILSREREKSFLLDFSQEIAAVRSKDDLQAAISRALQQLLNTKLAMIRIIEDDGIALTPYLWDDTQFADVQEIFNLLTSRTVTVDDYYFARVLASDEPISIDVEEEDRKKSSPHYVRLWKALGLKKVYASALRVGQKNLGVMFFLSDELNLNLLKGLCAQISIAISNIRSNEKVMAYKQLLEIENDELKEQMRTIYNFSEIVGSGPEMQEVYHLMSLVASSVSTVLLLGETGTGKELIARAIHNASPRKNKVMIKVNCAALPASLIESELFGHERGAFTGAIERRVGKFELAHNSTLFLDEIGEMPLEAQVKLLRVLQEKELERVGGKTTVKVDVRIIAATNRDLEEEIRAGKFRSDLFYRLNVFPITLPPLRNRPDDIVPLAHFFVDRYSKNSGRKVKGISQKAIQELKSYSWPGNVRELEHLIERSVLLAEETVLREIHLPKHHNEQKQSATPATQTLSEMERSYIILVLRKFRGKIAGTGGAAEFLNIPATTLHSKIKKLKIAKSDYY
jgi:transcriptional regulator with GAF, ATPase, and Fis domain